MRSGWVPGAGQCPCWVHPAALLVRLALSPVVFRQLMPKPMVLECRSGAETLSEAPKQAGGGLGSPRRCCWRPCCLGAELGQLRGREKRGLTCP